MLVLSRKVGEKILIGNVVLYVISINGNRVKLGFEAPLEVPILRDELRVGIEAEADPEEVPHA
ncbi:MAG: carbon storage regulator [Candidatus Peribacteraceae bacterium]|nr:carbon storage regulator [Candidatus Peribacteraceae bacterium]MBP9850766.1 carbon storage regulator [Candidatus Peribacteraceae bacterium]